MAKKLFTVEVTYKAYAWAEDETEAEDLKSEIVNTEDFPDVLVMEAKSNVLGWDPKCYVYHNESGDIMLRDVLVDSQEPRRGTH